MERKELESIVADEVGRVYYKDEADAVMDAMELQHKADAELIAADRRNMDAMKERIKELEENLKLADKAELNYKKVAERSLAKIKELEERIAHTNYINKTLGEGLKDREARIKELEKKLKEIK